jgi:PilZ domain
MSETKEVRVESTSGAERRRVPRFPFVASAEVVENNSTARMNARVSELSLYGCYVDTINPLPKGASVFIKIFTDADFIEAQGMVAYVHPNLGMGIAFFNVNPSFLPILQAWLMRAMREMNTTGE